MAAIVPKARLTADDVELALQQLQALDSVAAQRFVPSMRGPLAIPFGAAERGGLSPQLEVPSTPDDDSSSLATPGFVLPGMDVALKAEDDGTVMDFAELERLLQLAPEHLMAGHMPHGSTDAFGVAMGGPMAAAPEQQLQMQMQAGSGPVEIPDLLMITDQPVQFGRFRYKSEQRERSLDGEKSCPEVQLNPKYLSLVPTDAIVTATLVTKTTGPDGHPQPHWHELGGNTASLLSGHERKARFENLVILIEKTNSTRVARNKEDQRAVRIQFQLTFGVGGRMFFGRAVSHPVYNAKLMINRLSHASGPVTGGNTVILLCSKVRKACTTIRVSERTAPHSACVFEGTGAWQEGVCILPVSHLSFHHQFAIVFAMPPFHTPNVGAPVTVDIEIIDTADRTNSQPVEYLYMPTDESRLQMAQASKKRKFDDGMNDFWRHFGLGGPGPQGGQPGNDPSGGGGGGFGPLGFGGGGFSLGMQHGGAGGPAMDVMALHMNAVRFFAHSGDARFLLAAQRGLIGMSDADGNNSLHHAIAEGRVDAALALAAVALPTAISDANNDGNTPLHFAVERRLATVVQRLVELGANVSARNAVGNTPVHLAARQPGRVVLECLLRQGAVGVCEALLMPTADGLLPAHVAVIARQPEALAAILNAGAHPDARDMCSGWTCLHHAAALGLPPVAMLLLKAGASVSSLSHAEQTPLHVAVGAGSVAVVDELLGAGASPCEPDGTGLTPLDMAVDLAARPSGERIVLALRERLSQGTLAAPEALSRMSSMDPAPMSEEDGSRGPSGDEDYVMLPESLKEVKISDADLRIGKWRKEGAQQQGGMKIARKLKARLGDDKAGGKSAKRNKSAKSGSSSKLAELAAEKPAAADTADGVSLMGVD